MQEVAIYTMSNSAARNIINSIKRRIYDGDFQEGNFENIRIISRQDEGIDVVVELIKLLP